jgi:hypothetical protein
VIPLELNDLREMYRLKRILDGGGTTAQLLEQDFLRFSSLMPQNMLTVKQPNLYALTEAEQKSVREALAGIGIQSDAKAIDVTGLSNGIASPVLCFVSPNQVNADFSSKNREPLQPLLEKIYTEGAVFLQDFTLHEALAGTVQTMRGSLNLAELDLFPEKFAPGPYTLKSKLDTPHKSVSEFLFVNKYFASHKENPKAALLNEAEMQEMLTRAVALRGRIGSLSRYHAPATTGFSVEVNTAHVQQDGDRFFLYNPVTKSNTLVYFGGTPPAPKQLTVRNGEMAYETLCSLLDEGFYQVSEHVLRERLEQLQAVYEHSSRQSRSSLTGKFPEVERLTNKLQAAESTLRDVLNPQSRIRYAKTLPHEVLDYMLCPVQDDPLFSDLLPRLSASPALRHYHDTLGFVRQFSSGSDEDRKKYVTEAVVSMQFHSQQNNDVNRWLYSHHKDFCEEAGIQFSLE